MACLLNCWLQIRKRIQKETLEKFCAKKEIPLNNILAVASDGAPAMTWASQRLHKVLKKIPDVLVVHRVIHRQHLVAKIWVNASIYHCNMSSDQLIKSEVTRWMKDYLVSHANDENFNRLLFHIEVRWLSEYTSLTRFCNLFGFVIENKTVFF